MIPWLEARELELGHWGTEIVPLGTFYPAEDYHQNYYRQHPENPYCQVIIAPKLQKLNFS